MKARTPSFAKKNAKDGATQFILVPADSSAGLPEAYEARASRRIRVESTK